MLFLVTVLSGAVCTILRRLDSAFWREVVVSVGVLIHVQDSVPCFTTTENSA